MKNGYNSSAIIRVDVLFANYLFFLTPLESRLWNAGEKRTAFVRTVIFPSLEPLYTFVLLFFPPQNISTDDLLYLFISDNSVTDVI